MKSHSRSKQNTEQELMLFDACDKGKVRQVQALLSGGIQVNTRDQRANWLGATSLMYAVKGDHLECVKTLLAAGADPNLVDRPIPMGGGARSSLYFAAHNGNSKIAALLLDARADVNSLSKDENGTALGCAVARGDVKLTKLLIQSGADPNLAKVDNGVNSLHIACMDGKKQLVPLLLDAGAEIDMPDKTGATPLMLALWQRQSAIVQELLNRGARVDLDDKEGITALMWAVIGGSEPLVRLMVQKGADISAKTRENMTAKDFAVRDRKRAIAVLLKSE